MLRVILLLVLISEVISIQAQDKIFRYSIPKQTVLSADPAFAESRSNIWLTSQIYNGLFSFSKNLDVHPDLVREYNVSYDALVYTFTIRKNIYFHDNACFPNRKGRELKAEDFVYSFKRIIDEKVKSTGSWIFADKVLKNPDGSISDTCFVADPKNPYRFKIYLEKRFPAFLQILAMPYCCVVPKEAIEYYGKDFYKNPVGTGAFELKSWKEYQKIILEKNPKYWETGIKYSPDEYEYAEEEGVYEEDIEEEYEEDIEEEEGIPLPYLDKVEIIFMEDKINAVFLKKNKLSLITNWDSSEKTQKILNKKFIKKKKDALSTKYIGFYFGEKSNPLLIKELRQALAYAINKSQLTKKMGKGQPAIGGIVPQVLPSYDSTQVKNYRFDIQKAKRLIEKIKLKSSQLELYASKTDENIANFLKNAWENIGLDIKVVLEKPEVLKAKIRSGKAKLYITSINGYYPDAENFLSLFYSKKNGYNFSKFQNEEFDRLFVEAQMTDNLFIRFENYLKGDMLILENVACIPLFYEELVWFQSKDVENFHFLPIGNFWLEQVDIK